MSAVKSKKESTVYLGTGRRKTSVARIRLAPGNGQFKVNGRDLEEYCYSEQLVAATIAPLKTAGKLGEVDITARVEGGGPSGQSGALAHGIARALEKMDADLRAPLKKEGHLTRDPRMKERKKSGQPGARKRFQFSKR